jgi:hypothetical protein
MLNFDWLAGLSMDQVKLLVMALFAVVIGWVWSLPSRYIYRGAPDRKGWRNLKLWATFVVLLQAFLYWTFG